MTQILQFPFASQNRPEWQAIVAPVLATLALAFTPVPLAAQDATSRAVVQPLPSPEVQRLNRALMELARRPDSVSALIEAGQASVAIGDLGAAIGFYGRAQTIEPTNPSVKLGLARVFPQSGRPVDALPLLASAQTTGADPKEFLSDRGLAFDLVGDSQSAQPAYARAIALDPDNAEAKRRLALSYAISGNRDGFESTLRPLLDARDFASFRTRAFGLAILGDQSQATAIVDAVMPRDLALRITPYFAYMPRLTKAQQAAAANLGIFPRAADIGREDPRIAAYAGGASSTAPAARTADRRLEPSGEPLGRAAPSRPTPSVADAFAELGEAPAPAAASTRGAVDIAAIEVPRESPEPKPPVHPSRIWVQVATGQDVSALRFDWRRLSRRVPELLGDFEPHVTPWGQSNRLLAGPVRDRDAARDLINALKEKGIDTFAYNSPEGTEIKPLK